MPRRLLLPALLISVLVAPAAAQPRGGRVEGAESLNVRPGPGLQHPASGSLQRGQAVEVLEIDGKWARIRYRDGEGWVFASFIAMGEGAPAAGPAIATASPAATATPIVGTDGAPLSETPGAAAAADVPPPPPLGGTVDDIQSDIARILTLTEAMHHDLERQRNSPPSANRNTDGISVQSGMGLLALGAVLGLLAGTIIGRQQERRGRPRVRL